MNLKIKSILTAYTDYYDATRAAGHSYAAIHGAKTGDVINCVDGSKNAPLVVVCNTRQSKQMLKAGAMKTQILENTEGLRGQKAPLIWDNDALYFTLKSALNNITALETRANNAEDKLRRIREIAS